jgi:hypothetical protein
VLDYKTGKLNKDMDQIVINGAVRDRPLAPSAFA